MHPPARVEGSASPVDVRPELCPDFLLGQARVLEQIATGAPLADSLQSLVELVRSVIDGMLCSLLLLDEDSLHLRHAAAAGLPSDFITQLGSVRIGPSAGACGTAAWRKAQVIVRDIHSDPLCEDFRSLARRHGLQACWSTPVFSSTGTVLGTFALYYHQARTPRPVELSLIAAATHLAGIAIERTRAAGALQQSEKRYRDLFDHASDLILIADPDTKLRFVNAAFLSTMEYGMEDLARLSVLDIIHPDSREMCLRNFQRVASGESIQDLEASFLTRGGRRIEVEGSCSCSVQNGEPAQIRGIFRDVTARREAERATRESLALLQAITEGIDDAVFVKDIQGRMLMANPAALRLIGKDLEAVLGLGDRDFFPPEVADPLIAADREVLASGERRALEETVPVDGKPRVFLSTKFPLRDHQGAVAGVIGLARDITDRKRASQTLRDLATRLMQAEDEERRRIALELHDSTAQDLVAVTLNLDRLEDEPSHADAILLADSRALLENAIREVRTLSYTLHPPRLEDTGLAGGLTEYAAGLSRRTDLRIRVEVAPDFGRLPQNIERTLFRVAQESLGNVLRHSESDAATLRLDRRDGRVLLEVLDFGRGLPPGGASRRGAGVGIAGMCERLSRLGGELKIDSGAGGTSVRAIVPIDDTPHEAAAHSGR